MLFFYTLAAQNLTTTFHFNQMFMSKPATGNQERVEEILSGSLSQYTPWDSFFQTLTLAFVILRYSDITLINEHTVNNFINHNVR